MHLTIINATKKKLSFKGDFQRITKITEQAIGKTKGIINVIFCDNRTSRTLNRIYRKKNKPTDVLTFTLEKGNARLWKKNEIFFSHGVLRSTRVRGAHPRFTSDRISRICLLAEIYLNVPYIQKEAKQDHQAFSYKMFTLFIHGILHSRGYDHEKDHDYRIMKLLEDKILKRYLLSKKS